MRGAMLTLLLGLLRVQHSLNPQGQLRQPSRWASVASPQDGQRSPAPAAGAPWWAAISSSSSAASASTRATASGSERTRLAPKPSAPATDPPELVDDRGDALAGRELAG